MKTYKVDVYGEEEEFQVAESIAELKTLSSFFNKWYNRDQVINAFKEAYRKHLADRVAKGWPINTTPGEIGFIDESKWGICGHMYTLWQVNKLDPSEYDVSSLIEEADRVWFFEDKQGELYLVQYQCD